MQNFDLILQKGKLYVPASKHYPQMGFVIVNCDKCNKQNIKCAIGYENYDICLPCAAEVERRSLGIRPPPPFTSDNRPFVIGEPKNISRTPFDFDMSIDEQNIVDQIEKSTNSSR